MSLSVNQITQEQYEIPSILDDSASIERFLEKNRGKKVVVVQGLGFVGAVMSLVCANAISEEYAVIGVDLPNPSTYWKIKSLNEGIFPLIADDPMIEKYFNNTMDQGNFYATYDPIAYKHADVLVVDINLDVLKDSTDLGVLTEFDVDLGAFKLAISSIGQYCKENVLILVETTVPPGTCKKIVKPIIDRELTKRGLTLAKYRLGHSYERVMPGPEYVNSIKEFPRVYSGMDDMSADAVEKFLKTIIDTSKCNLTRLAHTNATEMAKVLENSYRAMNIAFAVEWSRFAEEAGVNLYEIVNAIRVRKTHANLMFPGVGVGGYCLTKDPLLASWSRKNFFKADTDLKLSVEGVSVNDQMPGFAFSRLCEVFGDLYKKRVIFLGVSYRGDVGDTRYSPVEPLSDLVCQHGAEVTFHDPFVSYWEEKQLVIESDLSKVLRGLSDLIVISTAHKEYHLESTIDRLLTMDPLFIYDTVGLFHKEQLDLLKSKHSVSVLGRGDLD